MNCCEVIDMRFLCICMDCWIDCLRVMNMHYDGFLSDCHSYVNNWPSASSFLAFGWLTAEQVRWSDLILRSGQMGLGITNELWVLQIHLTSSLMSIVSHTHMMINTRFAIEVCQ